MIDNVFGHGDYGLDSVLDYVVRIIYFKNYKNYITYRSLLYAY